VFKWSVYQVKFGKSSMKNEIFLGIGSSLA
jgi:hypothetical protein